MQHPYDPEITGISAERQLRFSRNEAISSVKEVLKQASTFELVGHHKVQSLSEFDLENAGALKVCVIEGCNSLLSIVDVHKTDDFGLLQCLEKLHLFNLQSLQSIWNGSVSSRSLLNLKVLTIFGCHKLTWILDHKLAQSLSSLKHIKVENCKGVVAIVNIQDHGEIIDAPDDVNNSGILQKVEGIEVVNLPNLESICRSSSMTWNSLQKIVTISCKNLRNLPLTSSNAERLETIKCEASWWTDQLQLSEEEKQHFLPRCFFIIVEEESHRNARSVIDRAPDNKESKDITLKTDMMKQWPVMKVQMQVSPSWMGYKSEKLVVQALPTSYSLLKDLFLYLKNRARYVKELEVNLRELAVEMITIYSRKEQIVRILETSIIKEETDEYRILCKQIEALRRDYDKFFQKYSKHCGDLPSELPVELDVSTASNIIDVLQRKTPTIKTREFLTLAKLRKNVKKLHVYVSGVANKMKTENLIRETEPELVQVKHDDIDLPSVNEYVREILRCLRGDENRSIGVVGSIGVGKTNVMKRLNNQLGGNMSLKLDVVIWIDYPEELGTKEQVIKKMQDVIMERLKLKLEKANNVGQNAEIISMALSWKKYIVLIDQVSSTIDLDEVGINTYHKFGKVVVASSNKRVIKQMTDQQVEVKPLPLVDAWILFRNVCSPVEDPRIRIIADEIIETCGGLPLVIKLVAKHLKGEEDEHVWSDVKRMLQSKPKKALQALFGVIGNAYKLVYDALEESYLKKCLLFGALFPNNHKIYKDYLVECWVAEGFLPLFGNDVRQLRSGREHGAKVLRELTDKYLLEECSDNKYVTMPKFFRMVALEEQYPEEENCMIWVPQENELPSEEIWRMITRMSLISCKQKLPECPESYNISTLLLQCNPELVTLEDSFFSNMENLRILDMNQTNIESLPTSISRSGNLISLYLNDCIGLAKLPAEVNKLTKIEILDIRGTSIPNLPQEIGDMIRLRCLRVSFAPKGCNRNSKGKQVEVMISPNIISRLKQLEEFILEIGCCNRSWNKIANRIALELASLENLSTLSFHFPTVYGLKRFVTDSKSWRNTETHWKENTFNSFKISIGCRETQHPYDPEITGISVERQLRFSTNEEISSVKEVLKQASTFELVNHHKVQSLSEFDLENAGALKVCVIEGCNNLLSIVDVDKPDGFSLLQCLENLHLFDLRLLQSIWNGLVYSRSLSNLKVLTICGCPELTSILDQKLAQALSSLKRLKVENCEGVVEIVNVKDHREIANIPVDFDNSGILQKVETIEVVNLPNLESICRSASMKWNSLRTIVTISCKNLRNLPLTSSNAETLETIKCEESWWTNQLQISREKKQLFLPHCVFIVVEEESCNSGSQVYNGEDGHDEAMTNSENSNADVAKSSKLGAPKEA